MYYQRVQLVRHRVSSVVLPVVKQREAVAVLQPLGQRSKLKRVPLLQSQQVE